jgi:2-phosphosulfolactate phosphatase
MLHVHYLPEHAAPQELTGGIVVVTDVLRATTTICHALAAGARQVVPCLEVDEARRRAADLAAESVLLGGERQGLRIDGFHLGNSPSEYTAQRVAGRTIVFTTTNGTKALLRCTAARRVWLGAFVNVSAVAQRLLAQRQVAPLHVVCAGTRGAITAEDVLFAGALAEQLHTAGCALADSALVARLAWQRAGSSGPLPAVLRNTQGGRNLQAEGFDADIDTAAQVDALSVVPRFDAASGAVTLG